MRFVVQRHRARRLHYDLRLEMGGVLASWAVPKGPTLDPGARLLAVHVDDHGLGELELEGVVGTGDKIVWDRGTWSPAKTDDPLRAVADGELHFDLAGEKLAGRFVLVRRDPKNWLLIHKNDEHAVRGWDPEAFPRSVLSGRTNEEVAAGIIGA
jgi:bifunctional non-homologous end joining protein LigD